MRVAALLTPTPDWRAVLAAARHADGAGLDAIGLWDHYHSAKPDWAYVAGWSALGALAASTSRVTLLPMVLNNLHHEPGVLAKESSILAVLSDGRFELGIGAGDWPQSFAAWGRPFPPAAERLTRLVETVEALRQLWTGQPVTYAGRQVVLDGAICTPAPPRAPRVVVGVGGSRRTLAAALSIADELNVYAEPALVAEARAAIAASGRAVAVSVFLDWAWDRWPADAHDQIARWRDAGVDRACVSVGGDDMPSRIDQLGNYTGEL
jgi:alkanesulfonate monooxygenase SsuD/methylene tetrahydromethanopterin reductase-like flavin-dependent oxidoreductase (luciferase family)